MAHNQDRENINANHHRITRNSMAQSIDEIFKHQLVADDQEAEVLVRIQKRIREDKYVSETSVH